jgi:hypothetical protein
MSIEYPKPNTPLVFILKPEVECQNNKLTLLFGEFALKHTNQIPYFVTDKTKAHYSPEKVYGWIYRDKFIQQLDDSRIEINTERRRRGEMTITLYFEM